MPHSIPVLPATAPVAAQLLRTVLDVSVAAMALLHPLYAAAGGALVDFGFDYLNPAAQALTGLGEQPRATWQEHFPSAFANGTFAFYQRVFETGEAGRYGFDYQHEGLSHQCQIAAARQGEQLVVSFTDTCDLAWLAAAQPQPQAHEQAAHKQAEAQAARSAVEQLRTQQDLLGQILRQVPVAIATLSGPQHHYTFFNEPYQLLTAGRATLGRTVAEVMPEVEEQGFVSVLDHVYASGQPFVGTATPIMLHHGADGQVEQRYLDFVYQPLVDGQQRTQGILAFILDVTDRVRARKQADTLQAAMLAVAQRQKQAYEDVYQLFEQAPAAIGLLREADHRIEYLNPAYQALLPGQALRGQPLAQAQPHNLALVALLDSIYQDGQARFQAEVPVVVAQTITDVPRTRYFDFTYQAYRENGEIRGVSVFGLDTTAQLRARQQVQHLNGELAAINEEVLDTNTRLTRTNTDLDTFVYTASHDLKAPISNIEGLLLALQSELPAPILQAPLVARILSLMQDAVARFQQTIGHLTDISQLQQAEAIEAVDLLAVIKGVQLDLGPLIEASQATLTVEVCLCEAVRVAPKTLRSVVYNLLSNALKYRAPDRAAQVHLRGQCSPGRVLVEVQDNGLGLSEAQQGQLFGMFQRLHTHVEGSGVGLFMVKRLVENAGGTIEVQSQLGVGTTFTVSLPA